MAISKIKNEFQNIELKFSLRLQLKLNFAIEFPTFAKIDFYINEKYYFRITMARIGS